MSVNRYTIPAQFPIFGFSCICMIHLPSFECKRNLFILYFSKEVGVITTRAGVINKAGDTEKMIQNDLIASKSS